MDTINLHHVESYTVKRGRLPTTGTEMVSVRIWGTDGAKMEITMFCDIGREIEDRTEEAEDG